jgi:hypothetical protein
VISIEQLHEEITKYEKDKAYYRSLIDSRKALIGELSTRLKLKII